MEPAALPAARMISRPIAGDGRWAARHFSGWAAAIAVRNSPSRKAWRGLWKAGAVDIPGLFHGFPRSSYGRTEANLSHGDCQDRPGRAYNASKQESSGEGFAGPRPATA